LYSLAALGITSDPKSFANGHSNLKQGFSMLILSQERKNKKKKRPAKKTSNFTTFKIRE
jgi:hypothetical protein